MTGRSDVGPFSIVPRWVRDACKGEPWPVMVYACLADHADRSEDGDGGWTIGRLQIAEEIGASESTVDRAVKHLIAIGAVEIERTRIGRQWGWSRYFVRTVRSVTGDGLTGGGVTRDDTRSVTGDDTSNEPISRTHPSSDRCAQKDGADDKFERFWSNYPRNGGAKKPAKSAFRSALKRGHEDQLRAGLKLWLAHWTREGTKAQHIPHASTFLNQERYLNDPVSGDTIPLAAPPIDAKVTPWAAPAPWNS